MKKWFVLLICLVSSIYAGGVNCPCCPQPEPKMEDYYTYNLYVKALPRLLYWNRSACIDVIADTVGTSEVHARCLVRDGQEIMSTWNYRLAELEELKIRLKNLGCSVEIKREKKPEPPCYDNL